MSTRSITHIHAAKSLDDKEEIICSFYRHCNGYPEGHGEDLKGWLSGKKLVNGIGGDFIEGMHFNRAGTMAVQLMAHIQDISGCEVIPTGSKDQGEEYTYDVFFRNDKFIVSIENKYGED